MMRRKMILDIRSLILKMRMKRVEKKWNENEWKKKNDERMRNEVLVPRREENDGKKLKINDNIKGPYKMNRMENNANLMLIWLFCPKKIRHLQVSSLAWQIPKIHQLRCPVSVKKWKERLQRRERKSESREPTWRRVSISWWMTW